MNERNTTEFVIWETNSNAPTEHTNLVRIDVRITSSKTHVLFDRIRLGSTYSQLDIDSFHV